MTFYHIEYDIQSASFGISASIDDHLFSGELLKEEVKDTAYWSHVNFIRNICGIIHSSYGGQNGTFLSDGSFASIEAFEASGEEFGLIIAETNRAACFRIFEIGGSGILTIPLTLSE